GPRGRGRYGDRRRPARGWVGPGGGGRAGGAGRSGPGDVRSGAALPAGRALRGGQGPGESGRRDGPHGPGAGSSPGDDARRAASPVRWVVVGAPAGAASAHVPAGPLLVERPPHGWLLGLDGHGDAAGLRSVLGEAGDAVGASP